MALSCLCSRHPQADGGSSFGGEGTGTPFPPEELGFPPVPWAPCALGRSQSSTRLEWGCRVSPSPRYSVHPPGVLTPNSGRAPQDMRAWSRARFNARGGPRGWTWSAWSWGAGSTPGHLIQRLQHLITNFQFLNRWTLGFTLPLLTWFHLVLNLFTQGQSKDKGTGMARGLAIRSSGPPGPTGSEH